MSTYRRKPYVPSNRSPVKRMVVLTAGWFFIVLGVLGLFLPILQGFLFLAIGIYLLSSESRWMHHRIQQLFIRFPRLGSLYDEAQEKGAGLKKRLLRRFS